MHRILLLAINFIIASVILYVILAAIQPPKDMSVVKGTGKEVATELKQYDSGCVALNYHLIRRDGPLQKAYHNVAGYDFNQVYNVYESDFREQMQRLKDENVDVYSLDQINEMMKTNTVPNHCVTITFDDIDESVYKVAYPIMKEYNYPFSIFEVTGKMPADWGLVQAKLSDVQKMAQDDLVTVGLHTNSMHGIDSLTGQPVFLDPRRIDDFAKDTKVSIEKYRKYFNQDPKYFAYPHGFGTPETDKVLLDDGFDLLFTLKGGAINNETDKSFVPRVLITNESFDAVMDWLEETK